MLAVKEGGIRTGQEKDRKSGRHRSEYSFAFQVFFLGVPTLLSVSAGSSFPGNDLVPPLTCRITVSLAGGTG